jgi:hypothetical protein
MGAKMSVSVKSWSNTGAVLLTAGAIAVAPLVAPPPPNLHPAAIAQQVSQRLDVELAAAAGPLEAAGEIIQGLINSAGRAATAVVGIPAGLVALVSAIATGTQNDVAALVNNAISAPLWVADPTMEAVNNVMPTPIGQGIDYFTGGTNSWVTAVRNLGLWQATHFTEQVADAGIAVAYGATASLVNAAKYVVGLPAAFVPIVQAVFARNPVALYNAILPITTGVTWMVDPVLLALNSVLPAPFGQAGDIKAGATNSWVAAFRNTVIWAASRFVNVVIAKILGVPGPPANSQGIPIPTAATSPVPAATTPLTLSAAATAKAPAAADDTSAPKTKATDHKRTHVAAVSGDKTDVTAATTDSTSTSTDSDTTTSKPVSHDHKSGKTDGKNTHHQKGSSHKQDKASNGSSGKTSGKHVTK